MSLPFSFSFQNKLNLMVAVLFLFAVLMYSTVFLILVKKYHPNSSCIVLTAGKENKKGFLLETLTITFNKFLKAFVHSNIIQSHPIKLIALLGLNFCQLITVLRLRKFFVTTPFFVFTFLYDLSFMLLDINLYLNFYDKSFSVAGFTFNSQVNYTIIALIFLSVCKSIILFKEDIVEVFQGQCPCFESNKI